MVGLAATFGLILLFANALSFWLDERVRAWPTTPGRLLSVDIAQDEIGVRSGRYANIPMRDRRFHVRYSYTVAGAVYIGTQIGAHRAAARVGGRPDRFVVGQAVTAHYNPADPSEAVIETPFPTIAVFGIMVGLALLETAWHVYRSESRPGPGGSVERDANGPLQPTSADVKEL